MLGRFCFPKACKEAPHGKISQIPMRQVRINPELPEVNLAIARIEGDTLFPKICDAARRVAEMGLFFIRNLAGRIALSVNLVDLWNIRFITVINANTKNPDLLTSPGRYTNHIDSIWISPDQNNPGEAGTDERSFHMKWIRIIRNLSSLPFRTQTVTDEDGKTKLFPVKRVGRAFSVMGIDHPEKDDFDAGIDRLLDIIDQDTSFAPDKFENRQYHPHPTIHKMSGGDHPFQTYFDGSIIGMVVLSPDMCFIESNESFSQMTGYRKKELLTLKWDDLTHPDDVEKSRCEYSRLLKGEMDFSVNDKRIVRKDGLTIFVHIAMSAVKKASGELDCLVVNIEDVTERKKTLESIWHQANFDMLTGLPNRFMFIDRLKEEIKKSHRGGSFLALFFIDLDRFKEINDTLGHRLGDQLLIEAASRISHCIRNSDTASRFGGDEFTVILSQITDAQHIEEVAQKILEALSDPFTLEGVKEAVFISASIGITIYPTDGLDANKLLQNADQSMYAAKQAGRNRFAYFTSALQEKAQTRLLLLNELRAALALSEFSLYFQPILDFKSGKIVKAEALLRWHHPQRGLLCPPSFIAIAEESGLIREIGYFVFREAGKWAKRWSSIGPDGFQVSINLSPVQFESNGQFLEKCLNHFEAQGLSGKSLSIEISEKLLLNVDKNVAQRLLGFSRKGISVWIDDFGIGCSSLSYLLKFQVDYLKMDQSFIRDLGIDEKSLMIAETIILMAHKLGLQVVAEGVETLDQRNLLTSMDCDFGQGFLFSKPLPPPEFEDFLHQYL